MGAFNKGTIAAVNAFVDCPISGGASCGIAITTDAGWVGTLRVQVHGNMEGDTAQWINTNFINANGGASNQQFTDANTSALFQTEVGSYQRVRVVATAYTSGNAVVTVTVGDGTQCVWLLGGLPASQAIIGAIFGTAGDGVAASQNPVRVAGRDTSGNVQTLKTDTVGRSVPALYFNNVSGTLTAAGQNVPIATTGIATVGVQVTGTWTGEIEFIGSINGTQFDGRIGKVPEQLRLADKLTANGIAIVDVAGDVEFRVIAAGTWTGTANILLHPSMVPASIIGPRPYQTTQNIAGEFFPFELAALYGFDGTNARRLTMRSLMNSAPLDVSVVDAIGNQIGFEDRRMRRLLEEILLEFRIQRGAI